MATSTNPLDNKKFRILTGITCLINFRWVFRFRRVFFDMGGIFFFFVQGGSKISIPAILLETIQILFQNKKSDFQPLCVFHFKRCNIWKYWAKTLYTWLKKYIQKTKWETRMSEFCSQPRFQNCHYQLSLYDNKKCSKPSKTSVS